MPLIINYIFQLIILSIGLGFGYLLLVTAMKQDKKWLQILGLIIGWVLIGMTITILIINLYSEITTIVTRRKFQEYPPQQMMMHPNKRVQMMEEKKIPKEKGTSVKQ